MTLQRDQIQGIIWDLDNTLYRFTDGFYRSCTEAAAAAAKEVGINLSYEDTLKLAERSEEEHGYSMHGYVTEHGISYASLHFSFHQRIDENVVQPIKGLKGALENLTIPQVILTNASRCWADRVLKHIEIQHLFPTEKIIPMEDVNFEPKARSDKGFKKALDILNLPAPNVLMVDDLDRNLMIPYNMGLQTVYMHHGDPMTELPDFIHDQCNNAVDLIEMLR